MESPFPGMDPFLEDYWGDVHTRLTLYASNQLQPQLPAGLRARVEEQVGLEIEDGADFTEHRRRPDVKVYESRPIRSSQADSTSLVATAEPLLVTVDEPMTERSVHIFDRHAGRLVTVIEFLSPANKRSRLQREQFQARQQEFIAGGTNVVEIDLVRAGGWSVSVPEDAIPEPDRDAYRAVVVRASKPWVREFYRLALCHPLPTIRIPLRPDDADAALDLQQLVRQAWRDGDYSDIDYSTARYPIFCAEDDRWIRERIAAWKMAQNPPPKSP